MPSQTIETRCWLDIAESNNAFLRNVTMFKKIVRTVACLLAVASANALAGEKLNKIFDPEMLGANLPYFEKISGPAKNTFSYSKGKKTNVYKIEGCEVTVEVSNGSIESLGLNGLSPKCSFNINKFLPNMVGLPPLYNMTFGQFDSATGGGLYGADCLMGCGAAAESNAYAVWQASMADNAHEVQVGVILSDPAWDAASKWLDAMRKGESEDWIIDRKFVCNKKYNPFAQKAFKDVRITSVKIGMGLIKPACTP